MAVEVHIYGWKSAMALGMSVEHAGDGEIIDRSWRAVQEATADVGPLLRASALATLPKRGGLGPAIAAGMGVNVRHYTYADRLRVEVEASHQYDLKGLDNGLVIHPLFGNRRHWYAERVRRGWFTRVAEEKALVIREKVHRELDDFADNVGD